MIIDEPHTYGVAVQDPFIVKAADGSSFHVPIKGTIMSLENNGGLGSVRKTSELMGSFKGRWGESTIEARPLNSIDTEQGVLGDHNDVLALKTSGDSILVLRRKVIEEGNSQADMPWHLAMLMSAESYDTTLSSAASRNVLSMRIISARPTAAIRAANKALEELLASRSDDEGDVVNVTADEEQQLVSLVKDKTDRNILLMVFGDGKVVGYDLDRSVESSPVLMFLYEKYPVVIGMLAVVVAFVINEAR
ncbi:hypothetical protein BGZ94_001087 [Podila epigama]|nr:hypothetical protein BGZ94_001087 [Podila epigama]